MSFNLFFQVILNFILLSLLLFFHNQIMTEVDIYQVKLNYYFLISYLHKEKYFKEIDIIKFGFDIFTIKFFYTYYTSRN